MVISSRSRRFIIFLEILTLSIGVDLKPYVFKIKLFLAISSSVEHCVISFLFRFNLHLDTITSRMLHCLHYWFRRSFCQNLFHWFALFKSQLCAYRWIKGFSTLAALVTINCIRSRSWHNSCVISWCG